METRMSRTTSRDQSNAVIARFALNTNWGALGFDHVQSRIIALGETEFGRRATQWLLAGCPDVKDEVILEQRRRQRVLYFEDGDVTTVDLSSAHNPLAFWRPLQRSAGGCFMEAPEGCPPLKLSPRFQREILSRASIRAPSEPVKVPYAHLKDGVRGIDIRETVPNYVPFTPTDACAVIASMISNLSKDGNGLRSDRMNFVPCEEFDIRVWWTFIHGNMQGWDIGADTLTPSYHLKETRWFSASMMSNSA